MCTVMADLKGAPAVHFDFPLQSFSLYITFKRRIAAVGEPIPGGLVNGISVSDCVLQARRHQPLYHCVLYCSVYSMTVYCRQDDSSLSIRCVPKSVHIDSRKVPGLPLFLPHAFFQILCSLLLRPSFSLSFFLLHSFFCHYSKKIPSFFLPSSCLMPPAFFPLSPASHHLHT